MPVDKYLQLWASVESALKKTKHILLATSSRKWATIRKNVQIIEIVLFKNYLFLIYFIYIPS